MKPPLAIFVLWHHGYAEGERFANSIFSNFKRHVSEPLSRGPNVPVYFRSHEENLLEIPDSEYEHVVIVAIIDSKFALDQRYRDYITQIIKKDKKNILVLPVANSQSSFNVSFSSINFIRLFDKDNKEDFLISSLAHEITRHLMELPSRRKPGVPPPLMLFISHAKADGLDVAKRIKLYVQTETALATFFDANDIPIGYEFSDSIKKNIQEAVIIAIHTDKYSSREWCRREILLAKENNRPIVILNSLKDGESRSFPYMANVLTVHYLPMSESVWPQMMASVMKETLRLKYQEKFIEYRAACRGLTLGEHDFISGYPPELITVLRLRGNQTKRFIYPDPALGAEELHILSVLDPSIKFVTASEL